MAEFKTHDGNISLLLSHVCTSNDPRSPIHVFSSADLSYFDHWRHSVFRSLLSLSTDPTSSASSSASSSSSSYCLHFYLLSSSSDAPSLHLSLLSWLRTTNPHAIPHVSLWPSPPSSPPSSCRPLASRSSSGWNILAFDPLEPSLQRSLLAISQSPTAEPSLLQPANLIRNYLDRFALPFGIHRALYLDADALPLRSLAELWETPLSPSDLVAVAHRDISPSDPRGGRLSLSPLRKFSKLTHLGDLLNEKNSNFSGYVKKVANKTREWSDLKIPTVEKSRFNAGVLLIQLEPFCKVNIPERFLSIASYQAKYKDLYVGGTTQQMPFRLAIGNDLVEVDGRWNACAPDAYILHCAKVARMKKKEN